MTSFKKIAFYILFLVAPLFSNTLIEIYKNEGITKVQEYFEKQLQSRSFWREYLKNKDVSLGYYENVDSLIICDKESRKINIFKKDGKELYYQDTHDVLVGKNGDKVKEGDKKTPVGVYDITKRFVPGDKFYGPLAYSLSYPNLLDKLIGKNGHGIWIHGYPVDGDKRDSLTKGCIVIKNPFLKKLDETLKNDKKIVTIIAEKMIKKVTKDDISLILSELYRWKSSWKKSDIDAYLSFYDKNFKRYDGMGINSFSKLKKRIFAKREQKDIIFRDINIIPYPNLEQKKMFKVAFYEIYRSSSYHFKGNKELYIEIKNDKIKIIAEK